VNLPAGPCCILVHIVRVLSVFPAQMYSLPYQTFGPESRPRPRLCASSASQFTGASKRPRIHFMPRKSVFKAKAKYEAFARHYVILNCNGSAAAVACGYAPKTADRTATKLLRKTEVKELVTSLLERETRKLDISVERTLAQLAKHAYVDARALYNADGSLKKITELDPDIAARVAGVEQVGKRTKSVRLTDQLRALRMLGEYLKIFAPDRNPVDLDVKVIILDAPRPQRLVAAPASTQLS